MKTNKILMMTILVVLALAAQWITPITVYADGETPPPAGDTTEETPPAETTETDVTVTEPQAEKSADSAASLEPTVATVGTSEPVPQEPPDETEAAAPDVEAQPEPPAETAESTPDSDEPLAEGENTDAEEPSLAEILPELPEGTDVVVLDENGQPEPLVTQEAAEIIAESDPMWCPAGATTVTTDCVSDTTVSGLITKLVSTSKNEDGVIYFYTPVPYTTNDVNFSSTNLPLLWDNRLTLQGGWNGNTTLGSVIGYAGQSVFNVPINVYPWKNDITVKDITVNTTGIMEMGMDLEYDSCPTCGSSVNIRLDNVHVTGDYTVGAYILTDDDVTISNSSFSGFDTGMQMFFPKNATITNSSFTKNYGSQGLFLDDVKNLTIENSDFSENDGQGIGGNAENVSILNSNFSKNHHSGTDIRSFNDVYISNSTFSENGTGVDLYVGSGASSSAIIEGSLFKDNGIGIYAEANVTGEIDLTLDCVKYKNNGKNFNSKGDVTVTEILCNAGGGETTTTPTPTTVILVPLDTDIIEFPIDCSLYTLYISVWPNGDRVQVACQDNAIARISRMDNTSLSELPAGFQYVSAFDVEILVDGEAIPLMLKNGYILASFMSRHENPQYDILYWDEATGEWLVLKAFQMDPNGGPVAFPLDPSNPGDLRKILKGVRLVDTDSPPRGEVTVNFTGILALVQR